MLGATQGRVTLSNRPTMLPLGRLSLSAIARQ